MPKLLCPCGFVHNLSPIPDEGWISVRDYDYDAFTEAIIAENNAPPGSPSLAGRFLGSLYECPERGRVLWSKGYREDYRCFAPEAMNVDDPEKPSGADAP
jgi:hypothetical protein